MNTRSHAAPAADYADGPRLLGDVGGTNVRFALERGPGRIDRVRTLRGACHTGLAEAAAAYLAAVGNPGPRHAAIAVAGPVRSDRIEMTNRAWSFSQQAVRAELGLETLLMLNDFAALAHALPHLPPEGCRRIGGGSAQAGRAIGVIGPGTGLGVAGLLPHGGNWIALDSEGGHASFAPADRRELAILDFCWNRHAHVSFERLVSGPGLELGYLALAAYHGAGPAPLEAPEIVRRALAQDDPLCAEAVECFCAMLGTAASNLALTLDALGGVYIGGGIVPRLGELFDRSPFRARFEQKGRYSEYLSRIPTCVVSAPEPALIGAAAALAQRLGGSPPPGYTLQAGE